MKHEARKWPPNVNVYHEVASNQRYNGDKNISAKLGDFIWHSGPLNEDDADRKHGFVIPFNFLRLHLQ